MTKAERLDAIHTLHLVCDYLLVADEHLKRALEEATAWLEQLKNAARPVGGGK